MKGKNLSKVLAFLLAAVMIFSALPLMAFASDETEPYVVSYGSPAIPINEMSIVDLTDLEVEMDANGTVVAGADITWAAEAQDGLKFDATKKTVFAKVAGNYKLTATANGVTKNVWVVAKNADETVYNIVDYDFREEKFNSNDWKFIKYASAGGGAVGTACPTDGTVDLFADKSGKANGYIQITKDASGAILVNTAEIFKDFRDYTVTFEAYQVGNTGTEYTGTGSVARVALSEAGTLDPNQNSILSFIIGSAKARVQSHRGSWWAGGVTTNSAGVVGSADFIWKNSNYHKVVSVYQGDNFVYTFDGAEIFDLSKASASVKRDWEKDVNKAMDPGYPGMFSWKGKAYVRTFSVALNTTNPAPATAVEFYKVSYGSPAIPMNENTAVDLNFISVEMDADGTVVCGDEIVWTAAKQENLYLNNEGKKVSVYAAGNYKLTATYNGVSKNVWVIAKKAEDTEFALIDYNFADGYNPAEWQFVLWNSTKNAGYEADPAVNPGAIEYNTKNGYVATGLNNNKQENLKWLNYGALISKNPIFDDFADYTVTSLSSAKAGGSINGWGGPGLIARVQLTDTGAIDNNSKAVLTQFLGLGTIRTAVNTTTWWLQGHTNYTCDASYIRESKGEIKNGEEGYNGHYYWTNTTSLNEYKILKGVYAGDNFALSIDETEVYNLSKATDADKAAWANDANHAVGAGAPGIFVWGGKIQTKTFKVTLNSNEMPDAIAAEVAPVEPEAEIVITGSGDAEVEAVVGSDNTFTVEIAPAEGYKVKVGSLVIDGKRVLDSDATGRVYTFTSEDLNATTISVEYIPDDGTFNSMMLGATIPVNPEKKGIRFGARTDFIRRNGETGFLGDKVLVDGVVYEPTEVGMLFIPSALIDGELTVNTERATRQAVSKVVKLTGDFSDIAITLVGIPESFFGVKISSRMYVAYEVDGETKYVYTEVIERSYNDVVAAIGK